MDGYYKQIATHSGPYIFGNRSSPASGNSPDTISARLPNLFLPVGIQYLTDRSIRPTSLCTAPSRAARPSISSHSRTQEHTHAHQTISQIHIHTYIHLTGETNAWHAWHGMACTHVSTFPLLFTSHHTHHMFACVRACIYKLWQYNVMYHSIDKTSHGSPRSAKLLVGRGQKRETSNQTSARVRQVAITHAAQSCDTAYSSANLLPHFLDLARIQKAHPRLTHSISHASHSTLIPHPRTLTALPSHPPRALASLRTNIHLGALRLIRPRAINQTRLDIAREAIKRLIDIDVALR